MDQRRPCSGPRSPPAMPDEHACQKAERQPDGSSRAGPRRDRRRGPDPNDSSRTGRAGWEVPHSDRPRPRLRQSHDPAPKRRIGRISNDRQGNVGPIIVLCDDVERVVLHRVQHVPKPGWSGIRLARIGDVEDVPLNRDKRANEDLERLANSHLRRRGGHNDFECGPHPCGQRGRSSEQAHHNKGSSNEHSIHRGHDTPQAGVNRRCLPVGQSPVGCWHRCTREPWCILGVWTWWAQTLLSHKSRWRAPVTRRHSRGSFPRIMRTSCGCASSSVGAETWPRTPHSRRGSKSGGI